MQVNLKNNIEDQVIIITGSNAGIGFETALDLAFKGATVILACRSRERANAALNKIVQETKSDKVFFENLDLSDLSSINNFAKVFQEKFKRLDVLINNAAMAFCPYIKTRDGFETQIGVNHLGHFLLTNLLIEILKKSAPSRIVNVSSGLYKRGTIRWDDLNWGKEYSRTGAYSQSKLANILFTQELAKRLKGTGVTAVSLHPGMVKTDGPYNIEGCLGCFCKCMWTICACCCLSPKEGAKTSSYCALSPDIPNYPGCYFNDCKVEELLPKASNVNDAEKLWLMSAKLVKLE